MNKPPLKTHFDSIPFGYLVAFPNVAAAGYKGVGAAHVVDGQPDLGVIIVAKDYETLQRFRDAVGIKHDNDKYWPLAVCYGGHVRWADPKRTSIDFSKYVVPPPEHGEKDAPPIAAAAPAAAAADDGEDW